MTQQDAISWFETQDWYRNETYKTMVSRNDGDPVEETLLPVKLEKYKELCDDPTWNGTALFRKQDGTIVEIVDHIFKVALPTFRELVPLGKEIKPICFLIPVLGLGAMAIKATVASPFSYIKFYAQVASGRPMVVDGVETPPPGFVSNVRIQGYFSNPDEPGAIDFRYGDLTPLSLAECQKLEKWDGKPVFVENGEMVRPHIAVFKHIKGEVILHRKDDLKPRLGISMDPYPPEGPSIFPMGSLETGSYPSEIETVPLFDEKLIEETSDHTTEEKKESP